MLAGECAKGNVIVDEGRLGSQDDLLIRRHIGDTLAIGIPKRVEQCSGELLAGSRNGNCGMRSRGHENTRSERLSAAVIEAEAIELYDFSWFSKQAHFCWAL